ncbi:putative complex i intermediate associated protein [Phaeomoniella chlamydospora]|uniref:Putative complex i intermediate associated protein n=1 Tax=Phaeomoniella chlamydospora TaxID=158046 RepID=A0A0G2ERI0_PHACM|nr:putative complex i intermediate associated protein [Phaeomoniella chlamydospora]
MFLPTAARYAGPGFFKRSLDELKRQAKFEGAHGPSGSLSLVDFSDPPNNDAHSWMKTMSDRGVGGVSTSELSAIPATPDTPSHIRWHGNISTALPRNKPNVQRTGYAAFRNQDRGMSIVGRLFWNVEPYNYLALRVKSDGRRYFVNVQTDSIVETDIHQHRLYTQHDSNNPGDAAPAEWETVYIKWHDFVRTNHGSVVEPASDMLMQKVKSVGIGLIDRQPGPFDLRIQWFKATNDIEEQGVKNMDWEGKKALPSELAEVALGSAQERGQTQAEAEKVVKRDTPNGLNSRL